MLLNTEVVMTNARQTPSASHLLRTCLPLLGLAVFVLAPMGRVWSQTPAPTQPTQQPAQPDQTATPDAGGPAADNGVIAIPKKAPTDEPPPAPAPAEPKVRNPEGMGNVTLHVDVPEVTVDVGVIIEKTGQFYPGLKPSNFKVYEDGVEQKVEGFK